MPALGVKMDNLISAITETAAGVMIAGDDEQALYQALKSSTPDIICDYYRQSEFANAMLPYCSRCDYYICLAASAFMARHRLDEAIKKIYLPLIHDEPATRVQVVATRAPAQAVDYIEAFVTANRADLDAYSTKMEAGEETDPWLLILSPSNDLAFFRYQEARGRLRALVAHRAASLVGHSADYRRVLAYCAVAWSPNDNFAVRKVLHYEHAPVAVVHQMIIQAIDQSAALVDVLSAEWDYITERTERVRSIAIDGNMSPDDRARALADIIAISDPTALAVELEEDPITDSQVSTSDEVEEVEAIETGGSIGAIELMTIVGSKGLSAQHVIVVGCDDVNLSYTSELAFFVALTRARHSLHLVASLQASGAKAADPFVFDLPDGACDYVSYTRSGGRRSLRDRAAFVEQLRRWTWGMSQGRSRN